jgi:hypothetical protein
MSLTGNPPEHEEIFNGPLWVIITVIAAVGLAAPLVLRWLYRKLKSTPRFVAPPSACR